MTVEQKSDGEFRRDRIVEILGESYPDRMDRSAIRRAIKRDVMDDGPLDNAIHVLKKRCVISRTDDGYQLLTAPAGYNERLVAERNAGGEKAPKAVEVSPMDEKPIDVNLRRNRKTDQQLVRGGGEIKTPHRYKTCDVVDCDTVVTMGGSYCATHAAYCSNCHQQPNECVCKPFDDELPADSCDSCDNPKDCLCGGEVKQAPTFPERLETFVKAADARTADIVDPKPPATVFVCKASGCGAVVDDIGQLCTVHQPQPTANADPCDSCEGQSLVNEQCDGDCSAYDAPRDKPCIRDNCDTVVSDGGNICEAHERELFEPAPAPEDGGMVALSRCPHCEGLILNGQCVNKHCTYEAPTDLDPIAVRNALAALSVRVTRSVDDKELKLEVLDYLGRILDDSIEAVLKSITEDLKR